MCKCCRSEFSYNVSLQVEELAAYLVKAFNVESLSLRNCGIGDEAFSKLVDSLMDTKSNIKVCLNNPAVLL